jgi:hypothetical protein
VRCAQCRNVGNPNNIKKFVASKPKGPNSIDKTSKDHIYLSTNKKKK